MAVLTVPGGTCQANQETHSATRTVPATITQANVRLTSTDWSNAGLAGAKVLWGIAYSLDGGTTWGPGICDGDANAIGGASVNTPSWAYETATVGHFSRDGGLPVFQFSGGDMPPAGALVRLFAWPTVSINLGAVITVT